MKKTAREGFTIIELLVAMAITGVLFSGGLAAYRGLGEKQELKQAGITMQSKLRLYQKKALSGEKTSGCEGDLSGFRLSYSDVSSYTVQAVCATANPEAVVIELPEEIEFTAAWSPEDIFFPVLSNQVIGAQTITLTNGSFSFEVVLGPGGTINGGML